MNSYMSKGMLSRGGTISSIGRPGSGSSAWQTGGFSRQFCGKKERYFRAASIASRSSKTSMSPRPLTSQCMRAPPISSRVTFSPMAISAMRGEPIYTVAFLSTMMVTSHRAGT